MNYIGLMNQMWRSAMMSPMPASEIALFAYLVNECNKRFWQMPFACSKKGASLFVVLINACSFFTVYTEQKDL